MLDVGVAEAVDRLAAVADHDRALGVEQVDDLGLERVRVLELVDVDAAEAVGVGAAQHPPRREQQILEVERAALTFELRVARPKGLEVGREAQQLAARLQVEQRPVERGRRSVRALGQREEGRLAVPREPWRLRPGLAGQQQLGRHEELLAVVVAGVRMGRGLADGRLELGALPVGGPGRLRHDDPRPLVAGGAQALVDVRGGVAHALERRGVGDQVEEARVGQGRRHGLVEGLLPERGRLGFVELAEFGVDAGEERVLAHDPGGQGVERAHPGGRQVQAGPGRPTAVVGVGEARLQPRRQMGRRGPVVGGHQHAVERHAVALEVAPDGLDQQGGLAGPGPGGDRRGAARRGRREGPLLLRRGRAHRHRSSQRHQCEQESGSGGSSRPARMPSTAWRAASRASAVMRSQTSRGTRRGVRGAGHVVADGACDPGREHPHVEAPGGLGAERLARERAVEGQLQPPHDVLGRRVEVRAGALVIDDQRRPAHRGEVQAVDRAGHDRARGQGRALEAALEVGRHEPRAQCRLAPQQRAQVPPQPLLERVERRTGAGGALARADGRQLGLQRPAVGVQGRLGAGADPGGGHALVDGVQHRVGDGALEARVDQLLQLGGGEDRVAEPAVRAAQVRLELGDAQALAVPEGVGGDAHRPRPPRRGLGQEAGRDQALERHRAQGVALAAGGVRRVGHLAARAGGPVERARVPARHPAGLEPVGRGRDLAPLVVHRAPDQHEPGPGGVDRVDEAQAALRGARRPPGQDVGERRAQVGQQRVGGRAGRVAVAVEAGDHHDVVVAAAQRGEVVDLEAARGLLAGEEGEVGDQLAHGPGRERAARAGRGVVVRGRAAGVVDRGRESGQRRQRGAVAQVGPARQARGVAGAPQRLPPGVHHGGELGPRAALGRRDQAARRGDGDPLPAGQERPPGGHAASARVGLEAVDLGRVGAAVGGPQPAQQVVERARRGGVELAQPQQVRQRERQRGLEHAHAAGQPRRHAPVVEQALEVVAHLREPGHRQGDPAHRRPAVDGGERLVERGPQHAARAGGAHQAHRRRVGGRRHGVEEPRREARVAGARRRPLAPG